MFEAIILLYFTIINVNSQQNEDVSTQHQYANCQAAEISVDMSPSADVNLRIFDLNVYLNLNKIKDMNETVLK